MFLWQIKITRNRVESRDMKFHIYYPSTPICVSSPWKPTRSTIIRMWRCCCSSLTPPAKPWNNIISPALLQLDKWFTFQFLCYFQSKSTNQPTSHPPTQHTIMSSRTRVLQTITLTLLLFGQCWSLWIRSPDTLNGEDSLLDNSNINNGEC